MVLYGPQSLKYLISGLSQQKLAYHCYRITAKHYHWERQKPQSARQRELKALSTLFETDSAARSSSLFTDGLGSGLAGPTFDLAKLKKKIH